MEWWVEKQFLSLKIFKTVGISAALFQQLQSLQLRSVETPILLQCSVLNFLEILIFLMYADYLFLLLVFIPQSVEGENHEKAVDLLKAAEGLFF